MRGLIRPLWCDACYHWHQSLSQTLCPQNLKSVSWHKPAAWRNNRQEIQEPSEKQSATSEKLNHEYRDGNAIGSEPVRRFSDD